MLETNATKTDVDVVRHVIVLSSIRLQNWMYDAAKDPYIDDDPLQEKPSWKKQVLIQVLREVG